MLIAPPPLSTGVTDSLTIHSIQFGAACSCLRVQCVTSMHTTGLEIARAGDRIALCGEHLALGMQQLVIVVAASMLTLVTGLFGA